MRIMKTIGIWIIFLLLDWFIYNRNCNI